MLEIVDRRKIDDFGFFRTYFSSRNSRFFHANQTIKAEKKLHYDFFFTMKYFFLKDTSKYLSKKVTDSWFHAKKKNFFERTIARIDKIRVFSENLKFKCKKRPQTNEAVHPHIFFLKI